MDKPTGPSNYDTYNFDGRSFKWNMHGFLRNGNRRSNVSVYPQTKEFLGPCNLVLLNSAFSVIPDFEGQIRIFWFASKFD